MKWMPAKLRKHRDRSTAATLRNVDAVLSLSALLAHAEPRIDRKRDREIASPRIR